MNMKIVMEHLRNSLKNSVHSKPQNTIILRNLQYCHCRCSEKRMANITDVMNFYFRQPPDATLAVQQLILDSKVVMSCLLP